GGSAAPTTAYNSPNFLNEKISMGLYNSLEATRNPVAGLVARLDADTGMGIMGSLSFSDSNQVLTLRLRYDVDVTSNTYQNQGVEFGQAQLTLDEPWTVGLDHAFTLSLEQDASRFRLTMT